MLDELLVNIAIAELFGESTPAGISWQLREFRSSAKGLQRRLTEKETTLVQMPGGEDKMPPPLASLEASTKSPSASRGRGGGGRNRGGAYRAGQSSSLAPISSSLGPAPHRTSSSVTPAVYASSAATASPFLGPGSTPVLSTAPAPASGYSTVSGEFSSPSPFEQESSPTPACSLNPVPGLVAGNIANTPVDFVEATTPEQQQQHEQYRDAGRCTKVDVIKEEGHLGRHASLLDEMQSQSQPHEQQHCYYAPNPNMSVSTTSNHGAEQSFAPEKASGSGPSMSFNTNDANPPADSFAAGSHSSAAVSSSFAQPSVAPSLPTTSAIYSGDDDPFASHMMLLNDDFDYEEAVKLRRLDDLQHHEIDDAYDEYDGQV